VRRSSFTRPGFAGRTGGEPGKDDAGSGSDQKTVEAAAVRLLARREHSTEELKRKLLAKGYAELAVTAVIEKLTAKKLVSDDRYIASFVHHHAKRGQGPVRIRGDLRQQGIDSARIEQEFDSTDLDWNRLAAEVRQRKFGAARPRSLSERAKQARFLQYRGFSADHIRAAMSFEPGDSDLADDDAHGAGDDPDPESI
jgi:regulatory protein